MVRARSLPDLGRVGLSRWLDDRAFSFPAPGITMRSPLLTAGSPRNCAWASRVASAHRCTLRDQGWWAGTSNSRTDPIGLSHWLPNGKLKSPCNSEGKSRTLWVDGRCLKNQEFGKFAHASSPSRSARFGLTHRITPRGRESTRRRETV